MFLRPFEAAFVLQRCDLVAGDEWSELALRNERGGSAALESTRDGAGRRAVTVASVATLIRGDALAEDYLAAIAEHGAPCPRAASPSAPPPRFLEHLWLLQTFGSPAAVGVGLGARSAR